MFPLSLRGALVAAVLAVVLALPAVAAASSVNSQSVAPSSTAASATRVQYVAKFTTSGSGSLTGCSSTITLSAPAGTVFPAGLAQYQLINRTTNARGDACAAPVRSNNGATVTFTIPNITVGAGDDLSA